MNLPQGGKLLSVEETTRFSRDLEREKTIQRIVFAMHQGTHVVSPESLVQKLRSYNKVSGYAKIMRRAADEIQRLEKRVAELEAESASR